MNMKSILTYLAVLTLSFNVFATEAREKPKIAATAQTLSSEEIALNQENSQDTALAAHIVNSQPIPQASAEKPNEFITALSVYLLIIIVYSIYGYKANSNNIEN